MEKIQSHVDFKRDMRQIRKKNPRGEKNHPQTAVTWYLATLTTNLRIFWHWEPVRRSQNEMMKRILFGLHAIFQKILTENQIHLDT